MTDHKAQFSDLVNAERAHRSENVDEHFNELLAKSRRGSFVWSARGPILGVLRLPLVFLYSFRNTWWLFLAAIPVVLILLSVLTFDDLRG